jgi:hypothetical protein
MSRNEAEAGFLVDDLERGILTGDCFATIDQDGVGQLNVLTCA